ncbi:MAG: hypothetical protein A2169_14265 [Deltaproteobacteria bacterium RBG_13_47_9]|nr:MAG: hypothetical protein A2169_14265 [Deltaproteobacteria bacterium RBG_13_47_9]
MTFPLMLSLSKHEIHLVNSPSTLDTTCFRWREITIFRRFLVYRPQSNSTEAWVWDGLGLKRGEDDEEETFCTAGERQKPVSTN